MLTALLCLKEIFGAQWNMSSINFMNQIDITVGYKMQAINANSIVFRLRGIEGYGTIAFRGIGEKSL